MNVNLKSLWTKNFILLLISNALLWMAFEMLVPTLPLMAENIGCSPSQIGLVVGTFTISALLIRPFASSLIRFIDKKYILLLGVLICMLATGSYMFSISLLAILGFRLLHGFGFGIASTFYATLATEQLPNDRVGEGLGYFGLGEAICMSVGPMIGIGMVHRFGFNGLFITGAIILLPAFLMILGITRSTVKKTHVSQNESRKMPLKMFEKKVLPQCSLALLIGIVVSGVMSYLSIYAKQQGITNVAWFFFISAITGILIRVISGKLFDKKGPACVLIPSGLGLIIAMILIAFSQSDIQLNIAAVFYGLAFGAIFPVIQAWVMNMVEIESREDAMGSFLNFFDLGIGGGSFILGLIAQATSYQTMYLLLILPVIAFITLTVFAVKYEELKPAKLER